MIVDPATMGISLGIHFVLSLIGAWIVGALLSEPKWKTGGIFFALAATLIAFIEYLVAAALPTGIFWSIANILIYIVLAKLAFSTNWRNATIMGIVISAIYLLEVTALAATWATATTNAVNQVHEKAVETATKTIENATQGWAAKQVLGIAEQDDKISVVMINVSLPSGSATIDMSGAIVIFRANAGRVWAEYKYGGTMEIPNGKEMSVTIPSGKFMIVTNRSTGNGDKYLEQGETYALAFKLPQGNELGEGQDWKIVLRTPYTQDLIVTGYAPEIIQGNTIVTLKPA